MRSLVLASMCGLLSSAPASSFTQVFAFGDSLSDSGYAESKLDAAPNGTCGDPLATPQPPYVGGACTNGPSWVEGLAAGLGLTAEPGTDPGGTNYAVGAATAAQDIIGVLPPLDFDGDWEDLSDQFARFQGDHPVLDPDALYVIVAGGNDIQFTARGAITPGPGQDIAQDAVDAIIGLATSLSVLGAQHFLFATLPDWGQIPDATLTPANRALATSLTNDFNAGLTAATAGFAGGTAHLMDMGAVYDAIMADPGAYGISDTTNACIISCTFGEPQDLTTPCGLSPAIQDTFLFFDEIHPTAVVHEELAAAALLAVPEPALALSLLALAAAIHTRRRRG